MGKFGKPQKSSKHKKIKFVDPFYHGDRKQKMLRNRDEAPHSEEQFVSRKFREFMRSAKHAQNLGRKSRKQKKEYLRKIKQAQTFMPEGAKPLPSVPEFKQKKGETEVQFNRRMDREAMQVIRESQIEAKIKDKATKKEEEQQRSTKKKEKDKERKQAKKAKAKEKKEDKKGDFTQFRDKVQFGEVVHAPPTLSTVPKHADKTEKPWVKSLIANDILRDNAAQNAGQSTKSAHTLGKGTKRKLLSPAQQERMDIERQKAIEVYRQMKKRTAQ